MLGAFSITKNEGATDLTITAAGTVVCDAITGLKGMLALLVSLRFAYGSGGSAVRAYVQTSADGGNTWFDVANVLFGTASETRILNLSAVPSRLATIPGDGALADDTLVDGLIGDRVRLKVVSTGTYAADTVLAGRIVAR